MGDGTSVRLASRHHMQLHCKADLCIPLLRHSLQGASIVYALLSAKPEYNAKVSVALNMGPVAFITKIAPGVVRDQATVGNDMVSNVALGLTCILCFLRLAMLQRSMACNCMLYASESLTQINAC
jgi:hypothetical protein